jgi:lysophospholipase L1-like esterase
MSVRAVPAMQVHRRAPWRRRATAVGLAAILTALAICCATAAPVGAAVLVVGDSLGVGTDGPLRAALPEAEIESDNRGGRPSVEGISVLSRLLGPEHDTVVFDLGTNDGNAAAAITAGSLAAARQLTGDHCLIVATLNRPPLAGIPIDGQNTMIRSFAATVPNVVLVEWNDAAAGTPGVLQADGVHATSAGYAYRGALFADAIRSCLTGGGGGDVAPPPAGRQASATDRPASARRAPRPTGPVLQERAATALGDRLSADGGPMDIARHGAALFSAAATSLGEVLTPRGPEPVLGSE